MNVYTALSFASFLLLLQVVIFTWMLPVANKERIAFLSAGISLTLFAFFTFLPNFTQNLYWVYFFDRLASLGWATFPVLIAWVVYLMRKKRSWAIAVILKYFLASIAIACLVRYWVDPITVKSYFQYNGIWFFEVFKPFPWFFIFVLYLMSSMGLILYLLITWWKDAKSNRTKRQIVSIVVGIVAFFALSTITNLTIPLLGFETLPPLAHAQSVFIMAGFFYALIVLKQPELSTAIVNRFIKSHLNEFVFHFDQNFKLYAVNNYTLKRLKYNQYEIAQLNTYGELESKALITKEKGRNTLKNSFSQFEGFLTTRAGSGIPVLFQQIHITDNQGSFLGSVLLGTDQTETIRLKNESKEREQNEVLLRQAGKILTEQVEKRTQELLIANRRLKEELEEKKRADAQINLDFDYKSLLLQEIHHRVKNNFQILISLIKMVKTNSVSSRSAQNFLQHLADKIRAISGVHEYFYSFRKLNRINFSDFLRKISLELNAEHSKGQQITIQFNVGDEFLDLNQALPCGLYFHEVLSHTLTKAFKPECKKKKAEEDLKIVVIEFYLWQGDYFLTVSHNGLPFDGNSLQTGDGFLNFSLIRLMANTYLGGTFSFNSVSGALYKLVFPKVKQLAQ